MAADRPIPHQRQAGRDSQSQKGAIMAPERHPIPNCKPKFLLTKTSDSAHDIHQEGHSQRSAPQKRYMAHLRRHACCTTRKLSGWDWGGNKSQLSTGGDCAHQAPGHLSCSDLGQAQKAGPTKSAPLWSTREPEPEWLRPGKCMQPRAHITQFPTEQPRA